MRARFGGWHSPFIHGKTKFAFALKSGVSESAFEVRSRQAWEGREAVAYFIDHVDAEGELNYLESDQ